MAVGRRLTRLLESLVESLRDAQECLNGSRRPIDCCNAHFVMLRCRERVHEFVDQWRVILSAGCERTDCRPSGPPYEKVRPRLSSPRLLQGPRA